MAYRFLDDYDPQKEQKKRQQNGALSAPRSGNSTNPFSTTTKKTVTTATTTRTTTGTALGGSAATPVQLPAVQVPKLTKTTPVQTTKQTTQPLKLPEIKAFGASMPTVRKQETEAKTQTPLKVPEIRAFGAGDYAAGTKPMTNFFTRAGKTITGGAKSSLASNMDAMGTAYQAGQEQRTRMNTDELRDAQWAVARAKRAYDMDRSASAKAELDSALLKMKAFATVLGTGAYEQALAAAYAAAEKLDTADLNQLYNSLGKVQPVQGTGVQQQAGEAARDLALRVQQSAGRDIEKAKEGLGEFGQMAVDAGASMTQMGIDTLLNTAMGTQGSKLPLALRAFGGATQQARADGADLKGQVLYGGAVAAKEVITEMLGNIAMPFAKAYGSGALDDVVQNSITKAVEKLGKTDAGKRALNALLQVGASGVSEGLEELIGDWMEWQMPRIYGGEVSSASEVLANSLYDFAVGGLSGVAGAAVSPSTYRLQMPTLTTYEQRAAEYRGEKPQNVSDPRIGRLEISSEKYNPEGADISTIYGNRYRQQVKEDAIRRLGIADGKPAYLVASNITKNGREYYVDVTKASLNKMLYTRDHEMLPLERILLVENLEKAIDNSYWAESNGDRKSRPQIDGFDTLRTSFYIDGIPYYADIKVKVIQGKNSTDPQNVVYFLEPEEITAIKKVDAPSPTGALLERNIVFRDGTSTVDTTVPQKESGVNAQDTQDNGNYAERPAAPLRMPQLTTYEQRMAEERAQQAVENVTAEAGPETSQETPVDEGYLDALARDENVFTSDPYTLADRIYDLKLKRAQQQEAPPQRPAEQVAQEDLDELTKLFADQANHISSREDRINETENMVADHTTPEKKTMRQNVREAWSYFYRKMVDAGHSVTKFAKATGDQYLYQFYNQARAASSAGVSMITDAQTNINAQKVGKSLNDIFSPIREKGEEYYRAFQMYLFDLHNIDRMSLSKNKEGAVLEAKAALHDFDSNHPEIRTDTEAQLMRLAESMDPDVAALATERMRLLRNLNAAEAIKDKPVFSYEVTADESRERARRALQQNPEFDQYRQEVRTYIDNLMQYRVDSGLMTQENADYLKKLYPNYVPTMRVGTQEAGAGRDRNAVRIGKTVGRAEGGTADLVPLHEALGRQTMKAVREGSKNRFGQRLLDDYIRAGDTAQTNRYVQEAHEYEHEFSPDTLDDMSREQLTKDKILTVYKDGKLWELTVDDTMFDALKALSPDAEESNMVTRTIRAANNLFKSLVTGYNPTFTVRNTVRDLQTAGLYTRDAAAFARNYPKALAEIKNNGEYWQMYKALGGSFSSVFDYNTGTVKEPKGRTAKLMAKVEALNMAMEQAPRLAEFMGVVEKGGTSTENLADALYAAADVTVNFGRAGTLGKVLNANYVPFLNPGIQGFDKLIRRVTETKGGKEWAKLAIRAAALGVAPALLNSLLYHDDEEWDELRDSDKDTNYMFKLGNGVWLKIPKGRELSLLGITADRITDAIKGEKVDILATLNTMGNQVAPANPLTSNIASALFEAQLFDPSDPGRTWYGGDIENQRMQSYAPGQRYDSSTDIFSKAVGGALGISPKKLNYVLDQYTGVVGDFLLPLLTPQAERGMFEKAFTVDVVNSNRLSGDFYDEADQLTYAKNAGDKTAAVVSRFWSKQQSACSDIYQQIREVEASDLSNSEKKQKTRELKAIVNGIQKNAMAVEETYRAAVEKNLSMGMDADEAYRAANKDCFGAEYALQVYNKDVYERAKNARSNGVTYEDYYTYYFGTKGLETTEEKSVTTQKFEFLQNSGMSLTSQAEIYFADMASDKTLETQAQLEIGSGITAEQFYQYKVASSGMTKKAEKMQAINSLDLTSAQKDAIYYAEGWAQSTIGQAPWRSGYGGYSAGYYRGLSVTEMLENVRKRKGQISGGYSASAGLSVTEMLENVRKRRAML